MPSRKVPPVPLHGINMCASFKHLISVFCHEHTLTLHRNNDKLELHTDASTMGIRAVLSVVREDMERPVAYYSKGLSAAEKNYAVSELECLAVVKTIDHFAIHLLGRFFTVVTNYHGLVAFQDSSRLNGCLMRWALALQVFDFVLKFRPGIHHQNANGLSRQCWPGDDPAKTPSTVDLEPDDEPMTTGPRLTQEVTSSGRGPKPEGRAPSLGGGDVEGSPQHCPRTIKMALRPELA